MAGDWMKIELELPDKPEVHAISAMLNLDPDCVVGKLIRVWQWFDKHTVDGNAYGVTYSLPDRISGVTGFGEAMSFVGWLEQHDKTLVMPKFDRHTSESAKQRALTAKRVAKKRNADSNAANVTKTLPEKRRDLNTGSELPDEVFGYGLEFLVRKGVTEKNARTFLGMQIKKCGKEGLVVALEKAMQEDAIDPTAFISGVIKHEAAKWKPGTKRPMKDYL